MGSKKKCKTVEIKVKSKTKPKNYKKIWDQIAAHVMAGANLAEQNGFKMTARELRYMAVQLNKLREYGFVNIDGIEPDDGC